MASPSSCAFTGAAAARGTAASVTGISCSSCQPKVITRILLLICLSLVAALASVTASAPSPATASGSDPWSSLFPASSLPWINKDPSSKVNPLQFILQSISSNEQREGAGREGSGQAGSRQRSGISSSGSSGYSPSSSNSLPDPDAVAAASGGPGIRNTLLYSSVSNYMNWLQSGNKWTGQHEPSSHHHQNAFNDHTHTKITAASHDDQGTMQHSQSISAGERESGDNDMFQGLMSSLTHLAKMGREFVPSTNTLTMAYDSLIQTVTCLANDEFEDPDLGKFDMDTRLYCNISCGRVIPGVLCCNPSRPELLHVRFRLQIRGQEEKILNFREPSHAKHLTAPGRIVFIVHGFMERLSTAAWLTDMRSGFAALGDNAIIVDWRRGNVGHYWQSMANTRVVAAMIGRAVLNWHIAHKTLIVGFSLGAQIAGEAGRFTQEHGKVLINECHGLDPAGPFYDGCPDEVLLDRSDCRIVQAIHTSAEDVKVIGPLAMRFGTYKKTGHCDYWINCGHTQGKCNDLSFPEFLKGMADIVRQPDYDMGDWLLSRSCSHGRAYEVYLSSLMRKCRFPAYACPECGKAGAVVDCLRLTPDQGNNTLPPFSTCHPDRNDNYFVSSDAYEPYCEV